MFRAPDCAECGDSGTIGGTRTSPPEQCGCQQPGEFDEMSDRVWDGGAYDLWCFEVMDGEHRIAGGFGYKTHEEARAALRKSMGWPPAPDMDTPPF